jgi:hypothetical protein
MHYGSASRRPGSRRKNASRPCASSAYLAVRTQFTDLIVGPGEELEIFLEGAKDFYYVLRWPEELWAYNAVGPAVAGMAACIVVPGMGDCKPEEVAQGVFSGLLRHNAALLDDAWMTYRFAPPAGDLWAGDLAHIGVRQRPRAGEAAEAAVPSRLRLAHDGGVKALEAAGIQRSTQKAVPGASSAIVCGMYLCSTSRTVSKEPGKRWLLVVVTARIILLGRCSPGLMSRLLGCWDFQLGFRSCGLCLFDVAFKWVQRLHWSWKLHRVPQGVLDELSLLVTLSPFWHVHLDASLSPVGFISDASLEVGSVVQLSLDEEDQVFLWQRARRGGMTTRLAPETAQGKALPSPDPVYVPDPLLHAWLPSARARPASSPSWGPRRPIAV